MSVHAQHFLKNSKFFWLLENKPLLILEVITSWLVWEKNNSGEMTLSKHIYSEYHYRMFER